MLRAILAVIIGYVCLAVTLFILFSIAYMVLGTEGSFQEGSYDVSGGWAAVSVVVGILAALLGGFVCSRIAPRPRPLQVFAVLILIGGAIEAVVAMNKENPGPRTDDVALLEAAQVAVQPTWFLIVNPLIGAAGVLIGGKKALKAKPS